MRSSYVKLLKINQLVHIWFLVFGMKPSVYSIHFNSVMLFSACVAFYELRIKFFDVFDFDKRHEGSEKKYCMYNLNKFRWKIIQHIMFDFRWWLHLNCQKFITGLDQKHFLWSRTWHKVKVIFTFSSLRTCLETCWGIFSVSEVKWTERKHDFKWKTSMGKMNSYLFPTLIQTYFKTF